MAYKVFMADHSSSAIKAVQMAFQDTGVDFYTAQDGAQVMDIVRQVHPDAVILALSLPNKDGYEVALDLTGEDKLKETPLLLLQGVFEDLDEDRIKDFEHVEIIQKPFDSEALVSKVQNLIGQALDPDTLPEEPEAFPADKQKTREEILVSESIPDREEWLKRQVKQEILGLERELEKRIVSRVKAEMTTITPDKSPDHEKASDQSEDT